MSLESDVRRMAATRPFSLMPREAVQLLAFSCERRAVKAGQTLFEAGEAADAAYFVLAGEFTLTANGEARDAGAGALIGETALVADILRSAGARAKVDSSVLRVPRETFRRVLGEFPGAAARLHASAAARTRALVEGLDKVRKRAFEN